MRLFTFVAMGCLLVARLSLAAAPPIPAFVPPPVPATAPTTTSADEPSAIVPGSWTMVMLPDLQYYNSQVRFYNRQLEMLRWVLSQRESRNIRMVITTGDITDHNAREEWAWARQAFTSLDGILPYVIVAGNHDYSGSPTLLNEYFKPAQNPLNDLAQGGALVATFEPERIENAAYRWSVNGQSYLLLVLEFFPRTEAVQWAARIAAADPASRIILLTHAYLNHDDSLWLRSKDKTATRPVNPAKLDGEALWRLLARRIPNLDLVLCGHIMGDQKGYLRAPNDAGNMVHQMLYNRQIENDGELRLLEFLPDNRTVRVKTYSPVTGKSARDPENSMTLELTPRH